MKRRIILAAAMALTVSFGALAIMEFRSKQCPVDIRPETRAMLQVGMSEKEIEVILGGAAGDYTTRPDVEYMPSHGTGTHAAFVTAWTKLWLTDKYAIAVHFDSQGKAGLILSYSAVSPPPSTRYPPPLRQVMELFDP